MIKRCVICDKEFDGKAREVACSEECKFKRRRQTQRNHALKTGKFTLTTKQCKICGKSFETYKHYQVVCSNECREKYKETYHDEYNNKNRELINEKRRERYFREKIDSNDLIKTITCQNCGREFNVTHKRKYCVECQKEKIREYNRNYIKNKRKYAKEYYFNKGE